MENPTGRRSDMSAAMRLDIPPRLMWGWGPGVSGYCGSATIRKSNSRKSLCTC